VCHGALALVAAIALIAGCSTGDDAPAASSTSTPSSVPGGTLPDDVAPGEGWIALDTDAVSLDVTSCSIEGTGTTVATAELQYQLVATGTVDGDEVTVTAEEVHTDSGDAKAVTQTVTITSPKGKGLVGLRAKRSFFGDRWVDLDDRTAKGPLFQRSGRQIEVHARFGPQGSRAGDEGIVDGALIAECPEGGG
jgi:hypothetical protein